MKSVPGVFRRGIVLPMDDITELQLRQMFVTNFMHVNYIPILEGEMFDAVWESGIFSRINTLCSVIIDDYEEEVLEPGHANTIIEVLKADYSDHNEDDPLGVFFLSLLYMLRESDEKNRPIFFIL